MRYCDWRPGLLGLMLLSLSCCDDREADRVPRTAEEMYARAQELIKPSADRAASDFSGALEWTKRAAEAGYLQAQTDLGALYMYGGKGVERDAAAAWKWFSEAAAQGSKEAELFLGDLQSRGEGVARDAEAAAEHWRRAAEAGIAEAQYRLGHYLVGLGQKSDEGVAWLQRAARDGAPDGVREAWSGGASGRCGEGRSLVRAGGGARRGSCTAGVRSDADGGRGNCAGRGARHGVYSHGSRAGLCSGDSHAHRPLAG